MHKPLNLQYRLECIEHLLLVCGSSRWCWWGVSSNFWTNLRRKLTFFSLQRVCDKIKIDKCKGERTNYILLRTSWYVVESILLPSISTTSKNIYIYIYIKATGPMNYNGGDTKWMNHLRLTTPHHMLTN